jgi:hypothetical protein
MSNWVGWESGGVGGRTLLWKIAATGNPKKALFIACGHQLLTACYGGFKSEDLLKQRFETTAPATHAAAYRA